MKRNLKLLSGIIMASFLSNNSLIPMENIKARPSRTVVVNSSSNNIQKQTKSNENSNKTNNNTSNSENISDKDNLTSENSNENETTENTESNENETTDDAESNENETTENTESNEEDQKGTTNILEMLNSDDSITKDKILELATPISYSLEFLDEFKSTFPDLDPLRKISPILKSSDDYIDINSKEIKNITKFLDGNPSQSVFYEQNNSNILLNAISKNLSELDKEIENEIPSTVFSLIPTLTVFSDTYKILLEEYNSIVSNNSKNQINLNILLQNIEGKLLSLLNSINDFKNKLPELIKELNKLADSFNSNSSNTEESNKTSEDEVEDSKENSENDESTENESGESTESTESNESNEESTEENQDNDSKENQESSEEENENTKEDTEDESEKSSDQTTEEETDPNKVKLYFGDNGQELVYDEETNKYYETDPDNPESDKLVEYKGNVTTMTLAEYLDMDLYFDEKGNELLYDSDTNSYFSYNSEKEEFEVYSGKVIKKKMKDIINK